MSRFGLRSHIEYEDDENDTTTTTTTTPTAVKTTKNKHKRVYQKKKKKLSSSSPQEQHENDNSNKLEVTTTTTSSTSTISLMCSLPLTRLSGFIEKLQLNKQAKKQATKYLLQQQHSDEANNILFDSLKTTTTATLATNKSKEAQEQQLLTAKEKEKEETVQNEEDLNHQQQPEEIDIEHHQQQQQHHNSNKLNKQKQQQNTQNFIIDKLLCLYCDKLFTTTKMQMKHIEKFHMLQQLPQQQQQQQQQRTDRRSSVRNSTNNQQQQKHTNCIYCKKSTTTTTATTNIIVDDLLNEINLNALFMHLIECHADKYFACNKCMLRFSNKQKLQKHMKMLHATANTTTTTTILPYQSSSHQQQQQPSEIVNDDSTNTTIATTTTTTKRSLRLLQQQTSLDNSNSTDTCSSAPLLSTEEPTILSRLGLAQNRLPTKRKSGMRLRREAPTITGAATATVLPDKLRSGRGSTMQALLPTTTTITTTNASGGRNSSQSTTSSVATESPTREVLFRMPARNESINSFVIDDDFYKEVINNVRHNLLYFLDGKLNETTATTISNATTTSSINTETQQTLLVRSTLVRSPQVEHLHSKDDKELHAASLLNAITAFPTLLTAEQYGGDAAKLRRAHTKHSWKWKWDSAKKFKLISEGGKMVKKMKPLMGLRDLSKLDMWTQLSMRQKFEQQQQTVTPNELRMEKLRLNAQLNMILDKRLLPQISLEQNEQTIIKLEKPELEPSGSEALPSQQVDSSTAYTPHNFLSALQLRATQQVPAAAQPRLILSGEWARPRSYMCMLCGDKFDKLKSLEEHKMFRHSHIYCTHYEVVGRELLANNLLQHLFLPKQALARYNTKLQGNCDNSMVTLVEDESSDSLQSSITMTTTTTPAPAAQIVSPTHSLQSCSSSRQGLSPVTTPTTPTVLRTPCKIFHHNINNNNNNNNNHATNSDVSNMRVCSKCQRKCSGAMDLYRHMLDCSGDYIWSMVKKRKYRYYCGSKKRRRGELRKTPKQPQQQQPPKTPDISMQKSPTNNQPTPRQRPSDAESIKKMLENLPAKRVCKQIFPVDNKKRSKKAITKQLQQQQQQRLQRRCKLLGKHNHHHPHHRLHCYKTQPQQTRALRARLRITKRSSIQQQKVNEKRVKQSQRNLRLKNLQKRKKQQQLKQAANKKSDTEEEQKSRSTTPKPQQQQQTKQNDIEEKAIIITTTNTTTTNTTTPTTIPTTPVTITETTTTSTVSITSTSTITTTTTATTMHEIFEYANSNASSTSTCTTITLNSAASIPTASATGVGANTTTTRKRSKRISDCIAMLTGKLEEKLKTEKQPITTTITTTPTQTKNKEQQEQKALLDEPQQPTTLPKTPKRKAQTRRILKPPSLENIVDLIEPTTIPPTTTIATNSVKTTVVATNHTSLVAAPTKSCLKNMHVISSSAMPTIMQLPPPMPKPSMATTHTVAATATPLISVESSKTKTNTATNKLQPPLNLPLPMPLPLPITIQMLPMLPTNLNNTFEEPLNLTNAAKKLPATTALSQGSTALATCAYGSNMYGLDMTGQQMYDQQDAGPLDLSVKSNRQENTKEMTASSIANIMPLALTVIPAASHSNQPLALTVNNKQVSATQSQLQVSAANSVSAAMFINECNKHFYSNLDLLKIPQVRSQLAALAATSTIITPATLPTHVYTHNVDNIMNTGAGHMLPGATKATMVVAPIVKKRGNNRQQMATATTTTTSAATATIGNNLQTTRIIRLYPNKKEHQLTMNEEVINHIDDAINSVINAVKASLTPERADDELEKTITTTNMSSVIPTTTATTMATILPTITTTTTTIPAISTNNTLNNLIPTTTINKPLAPLAPIMPIKRRGRSKIIETPITTTMPANTVENVVTPLPPPIATTSTMATATTTATTIGRKSKTRSNLCLIEDIRIAAEITTNNMIAPLVTPTTTTATIIDEKLPINEPEQITEEIKTEESVVVPTTTQTTITSNNETKIMPEELVENEKIEHEQKSPKAITPSITTTTLSTTAIDKELENLSEKSTPTTQKKFRRRRKNELAAIVADQLLESFKIDKARRDSLKKLENLAYEQKSDDLFMTGMLLMSSTKRSVTMNNSQKQQQQQQQTNDLEATTTKRTSLRNRQNNNNNNNSSLTTTTTTTAKRGRRAGTAAGAGTSRRRPYARRGKTLDNENISKLKSSLESFSIGIERQLTEFEAKKELQQQKTNEAGGNNNNNNTITTKTPAISILRPSILSATPSALTTENVAKVSEQSRSAFTSRDPRLNKNIHKETDDETLKKQATDVRNDYEEEDNYLTEIAKNVNDKIMDAENEDFMFANDGLLELEDTSSQFYSRPATSMSVRSAPNFDDRSDFGSLCGDDDDEEHTNTEVMDMDLDDEMSVYTSYSQDLGRGSGRRRRRRRRSILLTRRPKKRLQRNEQETEKFECTLCKKIFFSATSLSKHNMTLAHVSKVSEQEYLLSKAALLEQGVENVLSEFPSLPKPNISKRAKSPTPSTRRAKTPTPATSRGRKAQPKALEDVCLNKPLRTTNTATATAAATTIATPAVQPQQQTPNKEQNSTHVGLNSDERLFFECCTILKGTQEDEQNAAQKQEDSNHFSPYEYHLNNKIMAESQKNDINANKTSAHKKLNKSQSTFRDPPEYNKNEK